MYEVDKQEISQNCNRLVETIDLKSLKPHLIKNGVYTAATLANETGGGSAASQKTNLIFGLKRKHELILSKFVQSLIDAKQYEAAKILYPDFEEPLPEVKAVKEAQPTPVAHESKEVKTPFVPQLPVGKEEIEEDETLTNPGPEVVAYTMPDITEVSVKEAVVAYRGSRAVECYRMASYPRGYALIFVNEEFKGHTEMRRHGAAKDKALLEDLFTKFEYEVLMFENTAKYVMHNILINFTKRPELKETDSCILVVSSHGEEDSIICNDMQKMPVKDIKDMFNNDNCPALSGKPKLVIIQACRGDLPARTSSDKKALLELVLSGKIDEGVSVKEQSVKEQTDSKGYGQATVPTYIPTITDMMIAYSTTPGYASNRTILGSWYIYLLVDVFMKRAWNTKLTDMLMEVNRRMSQLKTSGGNKQSAETVWLGWRKKFYFNPGL